MATKILFCSEFPDTSEKSWRKRRWQKLASAKRFAFLANATNFNIFEGYHITQLDIYDGAFISKNSKQLSIFTKKLHRRCSLGFQGQFLIKSFCEPFRTDRNIHRGGILFCVTKDVPLKLLSVEPLPTECFFVEINLRKRKWLVCCSYNPHKDDISNHLRLIWKKLDLYSSNYESIIIIGDFNSEINDKCMNDFWESFNLSSLLRESTCYKNPENPSCIDLFLTNSPNSFQNSGVVETGLSDFHRMIVTVMKTSFQRLPPKIRRYRDYSNYDRNIFRASLINELSKLNIEAIELNKFIIVCIGIKQSCSK